MKILWYSNAPWAKTGYGNQTRLFWWRIQKLGHEVTIGANYGLSGAVLNVSEEGEATRVLPLGFSQYGNDILASYAEYVKADVVITLFDSWVFDNAVTGRFRWCPWLPVDHDPLPGRIKDALGPAWQPIAYSQFGQRKLIEAGFESAMYVPHGIDTKEFAPADRDQARKDLNFPMEYDFLAVMVAANKGTPSRKSFPEVLRAWKEFVKDHPKSLLYLHTHPGTEMGGLDLMGLLTYLDMPKEVIVFPDMFWNVLGYPDSYMARVYNAADVLLSPSQGEGFGLPIVEAQASGCPVIVSECTSMSELCFSGWSVGKDAGTLHPFYTPLGSDQFIPSVDGIRDCLEMAYEKRHYDKVRRKAREGALPYDADTVTETYWKPVLEQIAADIAEGDVLEKVTL